MYTENNTDIEKDINKTTFYFVAEGPGRGSEDVKKECNVNSFLLFCIFDEHHGWKNHNQVQRTALQQKNKETHAHQKRARSALSRERTLELRH
jgi:hypothetical protein